MSSGECVLRDKLSLKQYQFAGLIARYKTYQVELFNSGVLQLKPVQPVKAATRLSSTDKNSKAESIKLFNVEAVAITDSSKGSNNYNFVLMDKSSSRAKLLKKFRTASSAKCNEWVAQINQYSLVINPQAAVIITPHPVKRCVNSSPSQLAAASVPVSEQKAPESNGSDRSLERLKALIHYEIEASDKSDVMENSFHASQQPVVTRDKPKARLAAPSSKTKPDLEAEVDSFIANSAIDIPNPWSGLIFAPALILSVLFSGLLYLSGLGSFLTATAFALLTALAIGYIYEAGIKKFDSEQRRRREAELSSSELQQNNKMLYTTQKLVHIAKDGLIHASNEAVQSSGSFINWPTICQRAAEELLQLAEIDSSSTTSASVNWQLLGVDHNVSIYRKFGSALGMNSNLPAFKGVGVVKASVMACLDLLAHTENKQSYDVIFDQHRLIEEIDGNTKVESHIYWGKLNFPTILNTCKHFLVLY
jgi:hypothetical protein